MRSCNVNAILNAFCPKGKGNGIDNSCGNRKTSNKLQTMKEKIDGYHALVKDGHLSLGDAGDAIGDFIGRADGPNAEIYDDLHDYVYESYRKFKLE